MQGRHVRLEPLTPQHLPALCAVGFDPALWRWTTVTIANEAQMKAYIDAALEARAAGTAIPFATVDLASGQAVGSTRYMNIDRAHRRVEIGSTWIAPPWQRTVVNTEAKYLMLKLAFEEMGCMRVELKTDALNSKSRNAILRIGAKEEGTLRSHMINHDGRVRNTVYFSVIEPEWPAVKQRLEERLQLIHSR